MSKTLPTISTIPEAPQSRALEVIKTFTLNDLAKIALGAPKLTKEHLSVLQSLLIILLRKLDCHNETVHISGMPGKCLQKLLQENSQKPIYDFQLKNLKSFKEKYKLLVKLEHRLDNLQTNLDEHFDKIRRCHMTNIFQVHMWDFYSSGTEDLCSLYMPKNKDLCLLLRNIIFNKELRKRMTQPLVQHVIDFEKQIEQMRLKLEELHKNTGDNSKSQNCIQFLVCNIEVLRPRLMQYNKVFREAMEETQEMLNCKLERVTLPAIKKYLDDRFSVIENHLKILKKETKICASTKPINIKKKTCLSCTRHSGKQFHGFLSPIKSINERPKCTCSINFVGEHTILEKLDRMSPRTHQSYLQVTVPTIARPSKQISILRNETHSILINNEKVVEDDETTLKEEEANTNRRSGMSKSLRWHNKDSKRSLTSGVGMKSARKKKSVFLLKQEYGT